MMVEKQESLHRDFVSIKNYYLDYIVISLLNQIKNGLIANLIFFSSNKSWFLLN